MKFMFVPSTRNMFLPTLSSYDTEKGIDNSLLKHKILTFTGTEEKAQNISTGLTIPLASYSNVREKNIIMT